MAADPQRNEDVLRINALVDGELTAAERAALAARLAADRDLARVHATLASLKACVFATADDAPVPKLPAASSRRRTWLAWGGAAAAALIAFTVAFELAPYGDTPSEVSRTVVQLASFPADPVVPDLAVAGLKLSGIATGATGGVPTVTATYQGPRGCRLVLRVYPDGAAVAPAGGTRRSAWSVGTLAYELTAFGMPAERFAAVAAAAEQATRDSSAPFDSRRLRQASRSAPPCVG
jgi:anti-sigma factor RsiW